MKTFLKNIKYEFKRISWPNRKEIFKDLIFFAIALTICTLCVLGFDSFFNFIVMKIIGLFK